MRARSPIARGILQLLVPCAIVLGGALALTWSWRETLAESASQQRDIERELLGAIAGWVDAPAGPGVVVLGDSLGICRDARTDGKERVALQLRESLAAAGVRVGVLDLVHPGLQPIDFLALLNEAHGRRDLVAVVSVNLRFFRATQEAAAARLPQLARKLSLRQAWAVRDELDESGVSLLDVVLMRWKERLGLLYSIEGLRQWVSERLEDVSVAASRLLGLAARSPRRHVPPPVEGHDSAYRASFASHPQAATLRLLLREMDARGVPVLFYVAPVSPLRLAETGVDPAEFAGRVEELRRAVGASRDQWLDLHAAAPATLFRDRRNHLLAAGCRLVSSALTGRVLALLETQEHRHVAAGPEPASPSGRSAGPLLRRPQ